MGSGKFFFNLTRLSVVSKPMSFDRLKSARKAKELHSLVNTGTSRPVLSSSATEDVQTTESANVNVTTEGSSPNLEDGAARPVSAQIPPGPSLNKEPDSEHSAQKVDVEHPDNLLVQAGDVATLSPDREKTKLVTINDCYANLPSTLEIRESSRFGRGAYTKSTILPGATILSVTPHVSVVSTSYLDQHCSACVGPTPESGLKRCPKCKAMWYCNSECQTRDWLWHKRECSALREWATSAPTSEVAIPNEAVRCLGRILWGSQKEGHESAWAKEIRMLHSNRTLLQPSAIESHTYLAHSVVRYLGVTSPQELEPYGLTSAGDLVDLISRFTTNTFTLTTPALTPIGICVSPIIAFANHSCDPNAAIVFPRPSRASSKKEPLLHIVALRDIAPGDEVRISYIDTTLPKKYRQKELMEVYSFPCQCKLCVRVQSADPREALWCPKSCGGICPHPTEENRLTRCVKCNAEVRDVDSILDALRVGQQALDKATSLQLKDSAKAKQLTTNIIPMLTSAGVTPSSHPLLAMTRLHKELLIESMSSSLSQEVLDETIRSAGKYSAGLQPLLPKGHPVRAVALGELGKLLAVDEPAPRSASDTAAAGRFPPSGPARLKLAHEALVKAHEELLIGFGRADEGGQLGSDIRDTIVRLEKELGVWTTGIRNVLEDTVAGRVAVASSSKTKSEIGGV